MYSQHLPLAWHPRESELSKSRRAHRRWRQAEALRSLARRRRRRQSVVGQPGRRPALAP
ncbi:MAG TPA: hypothetical protein VK103_00780 [Bacillota bacterium]|nr:hypothetical protein [Bacillota bacterium]